MHATVLEREQACDGLGQQRLANPGHPLEQDVALREQGEHAKADRLILPDDRLRRLGTKARVKIGSLHADSFWFSTIDIG